MTLSSLHPPPPLHTLLFLHLSLVCSASILSASPRLLLLVRAIKEVWLPTVCRHSFFQTRLRHPGIDWLHADPTPPTHVSPPLPPPPAQCLFLRSDWISVVVHQSSCRRRGSLTGDMKTFFLSGMQTLLRLSPRLTNQSPPLTARLLSNTSDQTITLVNPLIRGWTAVFLSPSSTHGSSHPELTDLLLKSASDQASLWFS